MMPTVHHLSIYRLDSGVDGVEGKWTGMHDADHFLVWDKWRRAVLETSPSKFRPCQVGIVPPYL